jgi:hypothetical protein
MLSNVKKDYYAECHYTECRYAECRSTQNMGL